MPGHEKMVSVRMAPASRCPTCSPITVSTGSRAFRSACLKMTARRDNPFASAVRTYSRDSTSSMLARVILAMMASGMVASASAGRIRWRRASTRAGQSPCSAASGSAKFVHWTSAVPLPRRKPVGRTRSCTPKNHASTRPSQKIGIDTPVSAPRRARLSSSELRQTADATPIGMPNTMATTMAETASSTVAGKRRSRSVATGSPRTIDTPRSPWSTLPIYRTYCCQIGRSSPRRARTSATFSGVARSPSIVNAGSPGMRWMKLKTRTETPRSTGTMVRLRRMAYRLTALSPPLWRRVFLSYAHLGLPVELRPLRLLRELLGAQEHVGQRLVAVEALARGAGLAEEVAQEIVGIPVVPRPAEHVERHLAVLALVEVHRPLGRLQLRLD